ncbi:hypothetical protein C8Q74DRAFT_1364672 [Fomes fomentarius]|nr:hypothetical protein C8Q74DRAFT_1364672 [Fomes fomentarius]
MSSAPKLTKKQKKALAFRERKGKGKAKGFDELDNDVPIEENQDLAEAELDEEAPPVEAQARPATSTKKGGAESADTVGSAHKGKKRKREVEDTGDESKDKDVGVEEGDTGKQKAKKKRKGVDSSGVEVETDESAEKGKGNSKNGKQRYILFVGNLKYTTTKEAVEKHFSKCDPPPTVRLMTSKPADKPKPTLKSKGFAFVEFTHRNALQQGLKLHQSELEGRKINVELTAGGGGKSEARIEKVKKRNRELHEQRVRPTIYLSISWSLSDLFQKIQVLKRSTTRKTSEIGSEAPEQEVQTERPQRYSATSGVDQMPFKKRTWSIPEAGDDEGASGKKRGSKKGKKWLPKALGTGVNAIPVG